MFNVWLRPPHAPRNAPPHTIDACMPSVEHITRERVLRPIRRAFSPPLDSIAVNRTDGMPLESGRCSKRGLMVSSGSVGATSAKWCCWWSSAILIRCRLQERKRSSRSTHQGASRSLSLLLIKQNTLNIYAWMGLWGRDAC